MFKELLSVGTSLLGGLLGKSATDKANEINTQNQLRQEALQREFAQSGIQWKVEDAKKAGIHPLYALGANTVSYAPNVVGNVPDTSLPNALAKSGQDISRSLEATRTADQSSAAFTKTSQDLQLQNAALQNDLLATQIAKMRGQLGPNMPALSDRNAIDGQPHTRNLVPITGFPTSTPAGESTQDAISKEYGDEGLPQLPGQVRFVRDAWNAWEKKYYDSPSMSFGALLRAIQNGVRTNYHSGSDAVNRYGRNARYSW